MCHTWWCEAGRGQDRGQRAGLEAPSQGTFIPRLWRPGNEGLGVFLVASRLVFSSLLPPEGLFLEPQLL